MVSVAKKNRTKKKISDCAVKMIGGNGSYFKIDDRGETLQGTEFGKAILVA